MSLHHSSAKVERDREHVLSQWRDAGQAHVVEHFESLESSADKASLPSLAVFCHSR